MSVQQHKAMVKNKTVLTNGQKIMKLKQRLQYGDYTTLGLVLGCSPDAAKKRFERGNEIAYSALEKIIKHREELKQEFQKHENTGASTSG